MMASRPSVKVRVPSRVSMKVKAAAKFPARVIGTDGVTIVESGNGYTFTLDTAFTDALYQALDDVFLGVATGTSLALSGTSASELVQLTLRNTSSGGQSINFLASGGSSGGKVLWDNNNGRQWLFADTGYDLFLGGGGQNNHLRISSAGQVSVNANNLTLGGAFTTSGAFAVTFTLTNTTNVTLPTSGTLATTTLSNCTGLPLSTGVTGDLPFANLTQGAALTVLANATNGTADFAELAAGSDDQVLRRSGTALAFGAVNLASSAAVTGVLAGVNFATGTPNGAKFLRDDQVWATPAGGGDVTAASNFGTDNRLIRSDGTSKGVQASGISIDDSDNVSGVGTLGTSGNIAVAAAKGHFVGSSAGPGFGGNSGAAVAADASLGLTPGIGLVLFRDETVGGTALVVFGDAVNIIYQSGVNFSTSDPGSGGSKWYLPASGNPQNRYAVSHSISYAIIATRGVTLV